MSRHLVTAVLALVMLAAGNGARARDTRDWYPAECRTTDRCGPVEAVSWRQPAEGHAARITLSSEQGDAVIQRGFSVRASEDGRLHMCMREDERGTFEVTCLLVPPYQN